MFKDVLTNKHIGSVIKHTLLNNLSYVNTKHYKNLVFLLLQYHPIITILTSKFHLYAILTSYVCNEYQKIGSCRFKNDILLYLASVTSTSVITGKYCYAVLFFYSSDTKGWKFQKIEFPKRLYTIH